jgi:hypothetical protein
VFGVTVELAVAVNVTEPDAAGIVDALRATVNPATVGPLRTRPTFPANPLSGVEVMVDIAEVPLATDRVVGAATKRKSGGDTITVTDVEWNCPAAPLPVTVTLYVPFEPLQVKVTVAGRDTLVEAGEQVRPEGVTLFATVAMPEKSPRGLIATEMEPEAVGRKDWNDGDTLNEKSLRFAKWEVDVTTPLINTPPPARVTQLGALLLPGQTWL